MYLYRYKYVYIYTRENMRQTLTDMQQREGVQCTHTCIFYVQIYLYIHSYTHMYTEGVHCIHTCIFFIYIYLYMYSYTYMCKCIRTRNCGLRSRTCSTGRGHNIHIYTCISSTFIYIYI